MSGTRTDQVEEARAALNAALAGPPLRRRAARQKSDEVESLRSEIVAYRGRGATWKQIAELIAPTLDVSPDTIRAVIGARKAQAKRSRVPTERGAAPELRRIAPTPDATKTQPTTPTSRRFGSHDL